MTLYWVTVFQQRIKSSTKTVIVSNAAYFFVLFCWICKYSLFRFFGDSRCLTWNGQNFKFLFFLTKNRMVKEFMNDFNLGKHVFGMNIILYIDDGAKIISICCVYHHICSWPSNFGQLAPLQRLLFCIAIWRAIKNDFAIRCRRIYECRSI